MSQAKLGPLASRALGQAGLDTAPKPQQTDDLAARLDAPLGIQFFLERDDCSIALRVDFSLWHFF